MLLSHLRPVAQGLRTDHPIPGVAFVDDSRLPLEDPAAIEAIGRDVAPSMWGREDPCGQGWVAFTTDAEMNDLAWVVRHDPDHGRTVLLVRDEDAVNVYAEFYENPAVLAVREGGYWWDGSRWYRPLQIIDHTAERYVWRALAGGQTINAAQWADYGGNAAAGRLWTVQQLAAPSGPPASTTWDDDLALWAARRPDADFRRCVVSVSAPELGVLTLLDQAQLAELAGISVPALQLLGADRIKVPLPVSHPGLDGSPKWPVPVAQDWVEARRREAATQVPVTIAAEDPQGTVVITKQTLARRLTNGFARRLQAGVPAARKPWTTLWRGEDATNGDVQAVAQQLAEDVVYDLPNLLPMDLIAIAVQHALLDQIGQAVLRNTDSQDDLFRERNWTGLRPEIVRALDWIIQHKPTTARWCIIQVALYARDRYGMPSAFLRNSLQHAVGGHEMVDEAEMMKFLDLILVIEHDGPASPPPATVQASGGPDRPRPTLHSVP